MSSRARRAFKPGMMMAEETVGASRTRGRNAATTTTRHHNILICVHRATELARMVPHAFVVIMHVCVGSRVEFGPVESAKGSHRAE